MIMGVQDPNFIVMMSGQVIMMVEVEWGLKADEHDVQM